MTLYTARKRRKSFLAKLVYSFAGLALKCHSIEGVRICWGITWALCHPRSSFYHLPHHRSYSVLTKRNDTKKWTSRRRKFDEDDVVCGNFAASWEVLWVDEEKISIVHVGCVGTRVVLCGRHAARMRGPKDVVYRPASWEENLSTWSCLALYKQWAVGSRIRILCINREEDRLFLRDVTSFITA